MQALVNEPAASYGQSTTAPNISSFFSLGQHSSIYLSKQSGFSDRIAEMIQKLNRIKQLSKNWDSYRADAPSPVALANAQSFLIDNHDLALPFYFLAPGVNGEVMIEFKQETKAAELYFLPDGENEFVLFEEDEVFLEANLNDNFHQLLDFFNP